MEKQRLRVYKTEINDGGDPLRWPRDTLYPQKLALTSPTSGSRSLGIVRLRAKDTELFFVSIIYVRGGTSTELCGITTQTIIIFMATVLKTSNPTKGWVGLGYVTLR
jgi:hypothetical protein